MLWIAQQVITCELQVTLCYAATCDTYFDYLQNKFEWTIAPNTIIHWQLLKIFMMQFTHSKCKALIKFTHKWCPFVRLISNPKYLNKPPLPIMPTFPRNCSAFPSLSTSQLPSYLDQPTSDYPETLNKTQHYHTPTRLNCHGYTLANR